MKRALALAVVLAPGLAAAQVPIYPSGNVPDPPRNLDPGADTKPYTPPPPPAQPAPQRPNVIVVGPDGKPTYTGDEDTEPKGYYVDSGGGPAYQEPAEIHSGPVPELHVVRRGDTLWDICFYYFNDPWQWPKIWSYNPQITNPHWIYPGDLVRLLPRGVFAEQNEPEGGGEQKPATQPETKPDVVPPPQRHLEVGLKQTAFVEKGNLDNSIEITGSVDEKELLSLGDQVYLSYPEGKPPQVGKRYSIYQVEQPVSENGKEIGAYVHLLGALEVSSVLRDKHARGTIVEANQEIERHSKVGPLIKQYKTVPPAPPNVDAQGEIVAMLKKGQLVGTGELVFIDLGKNSGVVVGNRMFVVRRGDAYPKQSEYTIGQDDRKFPARALGEIVVVEVGDKISVGLVTLAVQEMGVGDLVMMQKASR